MGRIEFETLEEGREDAILEQALKRAILEVFRRRLGSEDLSGLVQRFGGGFLLETSDLMPAAALLEQLGDAPGLGRIMQRLGIAEESVPAAASALEFALEGLHLTRRINKESAGPGAWRFGE
jgi:magnesium chelatase subunit I